MKLCKALTYLNVNHDVARKKRTSFKGKNSYSTNQSYACFLINAGFISFSGADAYKFIDIVDVEHSIFEPYIINSTANNYNDRSKDE